MANSRPPALRRWVFGGRKRATPSVYLEAERSVGAHFNPVRAAITRVLRERGFKITLEHSTLLEARRGSQLALRPDSAPFSIEVRIVPRNQRSSVQTSFKDRWVSALAVGVQSNYQRLFEETQAAIDKALAELDPAAAARFKPPRVTLPQTKVVAFERATAAVGRATDKVASTAGQVLDGNSRGKAPESWRELRKVRFDGPAGSAEFEVSEIEGLLTVAVLVSSHPGIVDPKLGAQLEKFAARVETNLASHPQGLVRIAVSRTEVPVFEFMYRQAQIRAKLPLRTLHICQDCRFEKVTNPDYERLNERARKLRIFSGGAGFSISGVNPFAVVGALSQVKKLEPDFVCPQCQGMHSESKIVTFCPQCGKRQEDILLERCGHCDYDFNLVVPMPVWKDLPEPQPVVAPPQLSADGYWWWNGSEWEPVAKN